jgi:predicted ester cyclase
VSEPRELYRRWLDELWAGDLDVADEIVAPDFLIHQARSDGRPSDAVRGPEAARELVRQGRAPFSSIAFSIAVGPIVDGDLVAARWESRGVYAGGIPGASAPAGTEVAFGGTDILLVRDGHLAEYWVSSDGLSLMQQLGAIG